MKCENVVAQLPLMFYGELSFDEEEALQQHLDVCGECRSEMNKARLLHRELDDAQTKISSQLLQDCRRNLRVGVSALQDAGYHSNRQSGIFSRLFPPVSLASIWKPAAALALLTIGFLGGRAMPPGTIPMARSTGEPVASRVRFVQPEKSGRVQIVVEEVRQRVMEGGVDDDNIRGLLLSAAREANDPGVRVETMDLLKAQSESFEVRRALLAALQHDTNPGVRLKALEGLRGTSADAETRRVLTQVLLTDTNPGVRTQAIDLLTQHREPATVGVLQEVLSREDNNYVRLKCQKALREMNASVETF